MKEKQILLLVAVLVTIISVLLAPLVSQPAAAKTFTAGPGGLPDFDEMDAFIEKGLKSLRAPGASLVIVENDRIVHMRGFGVTGPGGDVPTSQTPFFIGSLTKSFTSLAVMQLVEAGQIELDAPVQRYLPWFTLADPSAAAGITIRHLLNQTSGISQVPGMLNLANFDSSTGAGEEQARSLAAEEPLHQAGSTFEYSNMNFNLLGLVIEAVGGETYADYMQKHVFAPLEMKHSYTSKMAAQKDGLAVGHRQWFGFAAPVPDLQVPTGSLASGQLISSAEDLGHYLIAHLNDGQYENNSVLSSQGVVEMHRPAVAIDMAGNDMGDYGMGWFIIEREGKQIIFHYGEVPDYFAYMALIPEQNRAFALLVNTNHQLYNYALWALAENAAFWLAGLPPQPNSWGILPWAMPALILLPIVQLAGVAAGLRKMKHWRIEPASRPRGTRLWLRYLILPGVLDVILILAAVSLLFSGMFDFLMLFLGDIVMVLMVSALIALGELVMRTFMVCRGKRAD